MPVTPTFPGIYVEELPSTAHTITAAPTSIAVFIGYSHPFRTRAGNFGKAVRLFSFTDYEREFGGFFINDALDHSLPFAVYQFFVNGGAQAYVIGLRPQVHSGATTPFPAPTAAALPTSNLVFTGLEPVDAEHALTVTIANLSPAPNAGVVADVQVSYGNRTETYRGVDLGVTDNTSPAFIQNRINFASTLINVSPSGAYGPRFAAATTVDLAAAPIVGTVFFPGDYNDNFQANSALDKIDIFNLMVLPGISDAGIWANALAFCERKRAFLLLDPPVNASADDTFAGLTPIEQIVDSGVIPQSPNGALYFPYLDSLDPSPVTFAGSRPAGSWRASSPAPTTIAASGRRRRASRPPSSTPPAWSRKAG
jgi:hypothetical protein